MPTSAAFYTLLSIIAPLHSAHTIDLLWNNIKEVVTTGVVFQITWAVGGRDIIFLLLIYLATVLSYTLQSLLVLSFTERFSLRLRAEISEKSNRLPFSFFGRVKTGEVLSRTVNDLDKTSETLRTGMLKLFTAVGMIVGSLIMVFRSSILLMLVFLVSMGIALAATNFASAKTLKSALKRQQCMSNVAARVEETYSGWTVIKVFNQEENNFENTHRVMEELVEATKKANSVINTVNPVIHLINYFG